MVEALADDDIYSDCRFWLRQNYRLEALDNQGRGAVERLL